MTERPDPTHRILSLLELLQAHHRMTGDEIAERLDVHPRTVRRYVNRLVDLGIPVEADQGRYGGYRLGRGYKLPPLMFTREETTAIVLGLIAAQRVGLTTSTTRPATESALAKLQRVLPDDLRERGLAIQETLGLAMDPRTGAPPETGNVLALADAVRNDRTVTIGYRSWKGTASERDLDPYGVVVTGGRWYVTGHDHASGEIRTFRVDRVTDLRATTRTFRPPGDFDPIAQVSASLRRVPYAHEVEVLLRAPYDEVRRRIPATTATLIEHADGVLVETRAERLDGMARMLAGLGWPFEIRRPDALRTAVRELARELLSYA